MTLTVAVTSVSNSPNTIDDVYDSMDSDLSPNWRVSNLTQGSVVDLGIGGNSSDVSYNPFTKRFGFTRNNFENMSEIAEADIVAGTAAPTIIRIVTLNGMFGSDSEGLSSVRPNLSEGGYEFWACIENGGRNYIYNFSYPLTTMFNTGDESITTRQELQMAATGTDNNSGAEGVDMHLHSQELMSIQEGQQASTPKAIFTAPRPTNRDTDYIYTDAELTVTEPFDLDVALDTIDASSCCYHPPTGHVLILSDTGNQIRQYTLGGTLIDTLSITGMFQPEGICMHGDNMVVMGEVSEYKYLTYVAP